ncbi:MAG: acyltransferase family protein [Phyllobacterium sp.]
MNRIDELEGLRGLLAAWVVIVHLLPAAGIEPNALGVFKPLFGELIRVQVFCIMSGFVIFMMMAKVKEDYPVYIARRLRRIYPVYILAFGLSILFSGIAYEALQQARFGSIRNAGRIDLLDAGFSQWPQHVLAHVTLTHGIIPHNWLPSGAYTFLGQAWNISTEFQFYLIAPLVFWCLHRQNLITRGIYIAGLLFACLLLRQWPNSASLGKYIIYFATGILSYYAWKLDWSDRRFFNPVTVVLAALVIGWFKLAIGGWIFIFGSALIVRDQERSAGYTAGFLKHPVMIFLGGISYSLYLLHMIPLYFWMYAINGLPLDKTAYFTLLTTLTFATAIPMSIMCNRYVESRFYSSKANKPKAVPVTSSP